MKRPRLSVPLSFRSVLLILLWAFLLIPLLVCALITSFFLRDAYSRNTASKLELTLSQIVMNIQDKQEGTVRRARDNSVQERALARRILIHEADNAVEFSGHNAFGIASPDGFHPERWAFYMSCGVMCVARAHTLTGGVPSIFAA